MSHSLVDPIVGEISGALSASAARYVTGGAQYHCAIGGLPFQMEPSPQRPYARETADFRAQQVDTSQTVGDQSLTGWWTRGQFSFHRGEGVKYYEALDGDEIISRYKSGTNVYPWTPGQLTLSREREKISTDPIFRAASSYSTRLRALVGTWGSLSLRTYNTDTGASTLVATTGNLTDICGQPLASDWSAAIFVDGGDVKSVVGDANTVTTIATLTGDDFWRAWWAKDRIWALDQSGRWYTFSSAAGQTIDSATDSFWTIPHPWYTLGFAASLTDSPGPVYISVGATVYAVSLDTSGAVPVVNAPTIAVQLPPNEMVSGLCWALGYVVLQTHEGVRVAQDQGGALTLGPAIATDFRGVSTSSCSLTAIGNFVYASVGTGDPTSDEWTARVIELNLQEFTSALVPAYTVRQELLSDEYSWVDPVGCSRVWHPEVARNRVVAFGANGMWIERDTLSSTGTIETGYHRFGTLESKSYRTLTVRAEGSGSIAISRVDADGVVTPLMTLGEEQFSQNEIDLKADSPRAMVALQFTLIKSESSGEGPRLLGYQLRALPAPRRQRLIQVPLMCRDVEKIGHGTYGHKGWAWERLEALEDMEATSRVVTWQNFVTGETALVFIEKVQFQSPQPVDVPGVSRSNEGHIMLTMRRVN